MPCACSSVSATYIGKEVGSFGLEHSWQSQFRQVPNAIEQVQISTIRTGGGAGGQESRRRKQEQGPGAGRSKQGQDEQDEEDEEDEADDEEAGR